MCSQQNLGNSISLGTVDVMPEFINIGSIEEGSARREFLGMASSFNVDLMSLSLG